MDAFSRLGDPVSSDATSVLFVVRPDAQTAKRVAVQVTHLVRQFVRVQQRQHSPLQQPLTATPHPLSPPGGPPHRGLLRAARHVPVYSHPARR